MSRGIIIFGSAGSGKTSLGIRVAKELGYPYYDIDDFIWRNDTKIPYSKMYTKEEKITRLMEAITKGGPNFVMAGSMDSFHAPFDPLFDLAIHITASVTTRLERIEKREYKRFGDRILEGGDLYQDHKKFLHDCARYDTDGSPCFNTHREWAKTLSCKVLYLDGEKSLEENQQVIIDVYKSNLI